MEGFWDRPRQDLLQLLQATPAGLTTDEAERAAASMLLSSRIGDQFDAICTGAADKRTWVRIFHPPVEGRLLHGYEGVDVGNRLKVRLIHTDVDRGYIDFEKIHSNP